MCIKQLLFFKLLTADDCCRGTVGFLEGGGCSMVSFSTGTESNITSLVSQTFSVTGKKFQLAT